MIDIIVPSYNDARIIRTLQSVRLNNSYSSLRIIIIDGGSRLELLDQIKPYLRDSDILVSEKDKGIFDALNKGLDRADSKYLYWLGSDDFISTGFDFSEAIHKFENNGELDCICYKTVFFDRFSLTRMLHMKTPNLQNYKLGFHLPHFSTIWRRSTLGNFRFDLGYRISADYDFFFKLMKKTDIRVESDDRIMVFMQEGGNSTRGLKQRWKGFKDVYKIHHRHTSSVFITLLALFNRYFFKIAAKIFSPKITEVSVVDELSSMIILAK